MTENLDEIAGGSPFRVQAYDFVLRALNFTLEDLEESRHVSGLELSEGIRRFAKLEFGPMAKHVLNAWGVRSTRDFGEIVFALVAAGLLKKTDEDRIEDFDDRFDFAAEFERDYFHDRPTLDPG